MDTTTTGPGAGEITLAFELPALERFERPSDVLEDARTWSRYVGVVGNDDAAVRSYVEAHELDLDFVPDGRDKWLTLQETRERTNTRRHVLVWITTDGRRAAERTGWEYVTIEEAAEKAEWELVDRSSGSQGLLSWLRNLF